MLDAPTGIARKLQESFRDFLHESAEMFGEYGFLGDCERQLRELEAGIVRPFNVAIVGMVKRGKSSIINALLERDLAITGLEETTATVNVISHSPDPAMQDKFTVHWKGDRLPETFPFARLIVDWSGKSTGILEKVAGTAFLQLYSNAELLGLHEIIDTPGLGAAVAEHEAVTQAFLDPSLRDGRKADALVYVFGPNAKESDVQNLLKFREGGLPHSSPYNSVGVLHKWDDIYWNSNGNWAEVQSKVVRTKEQMAAIVADVIPVSAPIATIAARATDEDLGAILSLVSKKGGQTVESLLQDDEDWNDDADCRSLRKWFSVSVPWICFRVCIREAIRLGAGATPDVLRSRLRELGGIDRLRTFLDRNFFKSAALIRQRQQYARFLAATTEADARIKDILDTLENDRDNWNLLFERELQPASLRSWIERKQVETLNELDGLSKRAGQMFSRFRKSGIQKTLADLDALDWCKENPGTIPESDLACLEAMADNLAGNETSQPDPDALRKIANRFITLRNGLIDPRGSRELKHLVGRIDDYLGKNGKGTK